MVYTFDISNSDYLIEQNLEFDQNSIFYFNCEHFLFVYIVKQKQKKFADFL